MAALVFIPDREDIYAGLLVVVLATKFVAWRPVMLAFEQC
jgi:hypothetical protein